jgi:hypothetical protein
MKTTISEPEHPDGARQLTLNLNQATFESLEAVALATGMRLEAVVEHALVNFINAADEGC